MECLFFCAFGSGCHVGICKQQVYGRYCWTRQQPACTTNTNYGEKGKGRREEQIQGLCSACGVYAPLKKCISSSTSSALCLHYLDAELGCTPHHSEPAGTAANHEKVKRFLYSSHFGFRIVQNNVPKNLIRF